MLRWTPLLLLLVLSACAVAPSQPSAHPYFADELFDPPSAPIDPAAVFAVSDEMQRYLDTEVVNQMGAKGRQRALATPAMPPKRLPRAAATACRW